MTYTHRRQPVDNDCVKCCNAWPCESGKLERYEPMLAALVTVRRALKYNKRHEKTVAVGDSVMEEER